MNKQLEVDLLNKLPKNGNIVIFGTGEIALKIYDDIKKYRVDINVLGFIECKMYKKTLKDLPVWNIKEFIDEKIKVDYVVFSTRVDIDNVLNILNVYDIPILLQSSYLYHYYRNNLNLFSNKNYEEIISMFEKEDDKELFDFIFKIRTCIIPWNSTETYYNEHFDNSDFCILHNIKYHYLEKINKNAVKTILDAGMNNGLNVIAFNRLLPNLKKTIAFEVIYNVARTEYVEDFILNDKLEIVPFALGDKDSTTNFYINRQNSGASYCESITSHTNNADNMEKIVVPITTIDKYCKQHKINPDFIKMDIEGAEMSALKGGIDYIKENRPQLAISIYHTNDDFINIPIYLKNNLQNYQYKLGHYSAGTAETVLYAIPDELAEL